MKRIKLLLLSAFVCFGISNALAQTKVSGQVTSSEDGQPIPGVTIIIKGLSGVGTSTNIDGKYTLNVPAAGKVLVFSYVGFKSQEVTLDGKTSINVVLVAETKRLDEVVVTALGISREKKSLGYATQQVSGEDLNVVKSDNFMNSLSGKVSGVQVKRNNNFGGSTNVVIRGIASLTGNNQALFVVDGVPVDNTSSNTRAQAAGSTGYDYGSPAADISPENIESMNVLKGSAASALYGSRAANGVILITTKSGKKGSGIGVSVNTGITVGKIDKSTFIKYQKQYGAGYGAYYGPDGETYFDEADIDGDGNIDYIVPTYDDASYGAKFDPNFLVYQWDSFIPGSENFGKKTPWVAAKNTPEEFFETETTYNAGVALSGSTEKSTYRLGYNYYKTNGVLPNSNMVKNSVSFKGTYDFTKKFKADFSANYSFQDTKGRNSTGYSDNLMTTFRQWYQVNADIKQLEKLYDLTGRNVTWNPRDVIGGDLFPKYWDNPYWTRYKNYQTDNRGRIVGYASLSYDFFDWLKLTGKVSLDTYNSIQEERRAVGSIPTPFGLNRADEGSGYSRFDLTFREFNYDVMLNFNKKLNENFSLSGVLGTNIRRATTSSIRSSTNGGLVVPGLYSLSNSASNLPAPAEYLGKRQVNGAYINASFGYKNLIFIEASDRVDRASTLPSKNNTYNYWSTSGSFIFSELLKVDWLSMAKIRVNYAEVGNDAPIYSIKDTYDKPDNFGASTLFSVANRKNNSDLKPEKTKSYELGLEFSFFKNRISADFATYRRDTYNQLIPSDITAAYGFTSKYVNAGKVENKGLELGLTVKPIVTNSFNWEMVCNWSRNKSLVKELYKNPATGEPLENITISDLQGGITFNATLGQPFGVMRGTGFKYLNGQKVVDKNGYYIAVPDQIIGDPNPQWIAGINNTLNYKNLSVSFLVDIQHGGDVFSLDMYYGKSTGLTENSVGLNDKGKPIRDPVANGGGILLPGVKEDGKPNDIYARADYYKGAFYWGNESRNPVQTHVYDASFVKLREVSLSYTLPKKYLGNALKSVTIALTGTNLWIIDKNVPYADPESGLGAGNIQGYLSGSYPTVKQFGFNVKVDF